MTAATARSRSAKWAVLISGRGSNLAALLDRREEIDLRLVVSSRTDAYGLLRARRAGVATRLAPLVEGSRTKIDWAALNATLLAHGITHVFLAGFMKVLPESFVSAWQGRILNLHPSLLPAYPGLKSIERAFADGAEIGVSVHEVTPEVDAGRVILQKRVLRAAGAGRETADAARAELFVHVDEQRAIREAIRRWRPIHLEVSR